MTFTITLKNRANRWIVPGSNQHKILNYTRTQGMFESEAAKLFGMHQGFHTDTMFDFMFDYKMADNRGHRFIGQSNDRGRAVADLLDAGLAVNLKTLATDKKRAQEYAEKPALIRARATFRTHKYTIIKQLFLNGKMLQSEVLAAIGFSGVDHAKYCKNLADHGLITQEADGKDFKLEITDLGRTEFAVEYAKEPKLLTEEGIKLVSRWTKSFIELLDIGEQCYRNRALAITEEAIRILESDLSDQYTTLAPVQAEIAVAQAMVKAEKVQIEEIIELNSDFHEYAEEAWRDGYRADLGKKITKLKELGFELSLSKETKAKLIAAKLVK